MKFIAGIILIGLLSAIAEFFLPWWTMAVIALLVGWLMHKTPGRSFLMGFLGIGLLWLTVALVHDIPNDHILSGKMAAVFKLPGYGLLMLVVTLLGGLIGGLAAMAGSMLRPHRPVRAASR